MQNERRRNAKNNHVIKEAIVKFEFELTIIEPHISLVMTLVLSFLSLSGNGIGEEMFKYWPCSFNMEISMY